MFSLHSLFPLLAIAVSLLAWQQPSALISWKDAVVPLLMLIMLCMGLSLRWQDFRRVIRKPRPVLLGITSQFLLMPILAWVITQGLNLEPELALGVLLVGSCAGGTASNLMTFLARGDVALSVTLTLCSTAAGVVMTPLLLTLLADTRVELDSIGILLSMLQIVVLPVAAGVAAGYWLPELKKALHPRLADIATAAILAVLAIVVALNASELSSVGGTTLIAVLLHNVGGLAAGWLVAALAGLTAAERRTLAIETGMQNSGLAAALAMSHFSPMAALPGALFSVIHNLTGSLFAAFWNARINQAIRKQTVKGADQSVR